MRRLIDFLEKRPVASFVILLALLFGVITLATVSRTPKEEAVLNAVEVKTSRVFAVSESGFVTASAKVKKSGVIDIVAATGGTVQSVAVRVGQRVGTGTTLATLTNDYGANAGRLAAEKSALETSFTERVYALEQDINKREQKIKDADSSLTDREEKNAIRGLKLELERLRLNRDTARLDRAIADASDAVLRPKALVSGTVEYLGVRPGETITAGTLIATIRGTSASATLVATLPAAIARFVEPSGLASLVLGDERIALTGGYLAQSENTLGLHALTFPLPNEVSTRLTESEFVTITLPLITGTDGFFVPIDTVLSGPAGESVLVLDGERVAERLITLGETIGSFVLVESGLTTEDRVLLNRGLLPGELVQVIQ